MHVIILSLVDSDSEPKYPLLKYQVLKVENWSAVFDDRTFCRLLIAVTLKIVNMTN